MSSRLVLFLFASYKNDYIIVEASFSLIFGV